MKSSMVICDVRKLKRIGITCRCGKSFVEEIPGELEATTMTVVIQCPDCHQHYGYQAGSITRLDVNLDPVKNVLQTKGRQIKKSADDLMWEMPESKAIN